jgi:hypothetical protein
LGDLEDVRERDVALAALDVAVVAAEPSPRICRPGAVRYQGASRRRGGWATAQLEVAYTRLSIFQVAQEKTASKGNLLLWALLAEVAAVTCVGIAIFGVINP